MSEKEDEVYYYVNDDREKKASDLHPPLGGQYINHGTNSEDNEAYNPYYLPPRNHPDNRDDNEDGETYNPGSPPHRNYQNYVTDFKDNEAYGSSAPQSRRAFADTESEHKPGSGRQRCMRILCFFAVGVLLILVLGTAGVSAYNLYTDITTDEKLAALEANAGQAVILHGLNVTDNGTFEVVLEVFVMSVKRNLSRINMDIRTLNSNAANNFTQIIQMLESVHSDLQQDISRLNSNTSDRVAQLSTKIQDLQTNLSQIRSSSVTKDELREIRDELTGLNTTIGTLHTDIQHIRESLVAKEDLAEIQNRLSDLENRPSSDRSSTSGHPLLLTMMGLMAVMSVSF